MNEDLEALQFTSNVIELKPDKKYLLLFKEINHYQLNQINEYLRSQGLHCICIGTLGQDVQVIEVPISESKSIPLKDVPLPFDPDDYPLV